jgi:hypothetical protein
MCLEPASVVSNEIVRFERPCRLSIVCLKQTAARLFGIAPAEYIVFSVVYPVDGFIDGARRPLRRWVESLSRRPEQVPPSP